MFIGAGSYKPLVQGALEVILKPSLDLEKPSLIFKVVKDETTLALKILNQEIDISLGGISPRKYNWIRKKAKGHNFYNLPGTNYKYIQL